MTRTGSRARSSPDSASSVVGISMPTRKKANALRMKVICRHTATDAMRKLFATNKPGISQLRNLGLSLTNRLPLLKSLFIRYALER